MEARVRDLRGSRRNSTADSRPSRLAQWLAVGVIAAICGLIAWHVVVKVTHFSGETPLWIYSLLISLYVLSRFVLAALYRPPRDAGIAPGIAIVVPAYNEGISVARTIHACMALNYPSDLIEVVCVNDGSLDDTWECMLEAASHYDPGAVRCIDLGSNQGKRAAMAAGIRATSAEVIVFVDSDSMPAPDAVRRLVQAFADRKVGAVAGITYARNAGKNTLTRMQAARYLVSYHLLKAAESVVNAVACCSGCFAAYRRDAIVPVLGAWEHQRFLGVECTYGDDRALTNMILKLGWKTLYDSRAEAWTDVPDRYRVFFKQQLRWKKSWAREGPMLLLHIWRSRPIALPAVLVATVAGFLSPIVLLLNLSHVLTGLLPIVYLLGLYLVAMAYGLLYRTFRADGLWIYAVIGSFFYVAFSLQVLWAILTIRDGSWGTRSAPPTT